MLESVSRFSDEVAVLSKKGEEFASERLDSGARPTLSLSFVKGSPSLILQAGDFFQGPVMLMVTNGTTADSRWSASSHSSLVEPDPHTRREGLVDCPSTIHS